VVKKESQVSKFLADNLIALRRARKLSQYDLASLAKVPRSTINQLESGSGNPSLSNLIKLSTTLQVPLEELLAKPTLEVQLIPFRELSKKAKTRGPNRIYNLLPTPISGVELERMEINVGSSFTGVPHVKGTKEYFCCIEGDAKIFVAGDPFEVHAGDVLIFPGDNRHSYHNNGRKKVLGLSVVLFSR